MRTRVLPFRLQSSLCGELILMLQFREEPSPLGSRNPSDDDPRATYFREPFLEPLIFVPSW